MTLIPVTILTGFLGSGKSTLLSEILRDPAFSNTAVVVNEFGDVGLDDFLVTHSEEQVVEMTTGCLCCTVRGDITDTLLMLDQKRKEGDIPAFERLIIETTGLADPAPVIHTLITEPRISSRFMLGGIICTVDAANGLQTLDQHEECQKQIAVCDRIVLTKSDLDIDEAALYDLQKRLEGLAPSAVLQDRHATTFSLSRLFDTTLYDPSTKGYEVERWLNEQALSQKADTHHHHHHHGQGSIESFVVTFDTPLPRNAFLLAMQLLIAHQGEHLLRIKGIVSLKEQPEHPIILHGVQHVFHDPLELDTWPSEDKRTRMVFITRDLSQGTVETFFKTWLSYDEEEILNMMG